MSSTTVATLKAEFKATGVAALQRDFKSLDTLALGLSHRLDVLAGQGAVLWRTLGKEAGSFKTDLTAIRREFEQIDRTSGRALSGLVADAKKLSTGFGSAGTAMRTFYSGIHTGTTQAESDVDRLQRKLNGIKLPSLSLPGSGTRGVDLLGSVLGVASGPVGLVTNVAGGVLGAAGSVAGGALGMAGGAAGAAGGFALGQLGAGIGDVAALDRGRAAIAAHMGTDFAKLPDAQRAAILGQITQNAFLLSSAPETGKVNSDEALAAMDEAAKAGITDPTAMMQMAKTALQLRAAGGEDKISTDNAMRLLITGKNAFGGHYTDDQVANAINGLVNGTTLDISQIQGILKNGGAANTAGLSLEQYLLQAGMFAQAGVNPGQIGGGVAQMLRMSQPRSATSIDAMAKLGLISTETHMEGGTPAQGAYWTVETDPWGQQHKKYHAATKGTQGTPVTTVTDNKLWDDKGNIVDPAVFFEKLLKGTQGMTNEQVSATVSNAFNPKAAGYIMQVLGFYKENPQAFEQLRQQMKQQSNVAQTAATQNDNLDTSLQNLGDTIQNLKTKALLPILDPLKGFVNGLTTLGQDALKGDWGAFSLDVGKVKDDLLAKFTDIKTWISTEAPKLLAGAKFQVLDVVRTLFGDDPANRLRVWFDQDLPNAWNGAVGTVKGLADLWTNTIRPILFGTDEERTQALSGLTGMVSTGITNFLTTDLPALLDKSKNPIVKAAVDLGGAMGAGLVDGLKQTDLGQMLGLIGKGDVMGLVQYMNAHGYAGMAGNPNDKTQVDVNLPGLVGGGKVTPGGINDFVTKNVPVLNDVFGGTVNGTVNSTGAGSNSPDFGPGSASGRAAHNAGDDLPHRAGGGRVTAGTLYRVNELGVELFRPDVNGTVVPAGRTPGGSGPITINITVQGGSNPRETGHLVAVAAREELGRWDRLRSPQS